MGYRVTGPCSKSAQARFPRSAEPDSMSMSLSLSLSLSMSMSLISLDLA